MTQMRVIDAHTHLGNNPQTKQYLVADLEGDLAAAGAAGAVCFAFPEDMYRTVDDSAVRRLANQYVLHAREAVQSFTVYPFCFVAMDYVLPDNLDLFCGIKWHRHSDEPRYDYTDQRCQDALTEIERRGIPMTLEEEFDCTLHIAETYPGIPLIIPHLGRLNGGPDKMDVFFDRPNIFFDTGPAGGEDELLRFLEHIGPKRLIMGSDYSGCSPPFTNTTKLEREKIESLGLDEDVMRMILGANIERLLSATPDFNAGTPAAFTC